MDHALGSIVTTESQKESKEIRNINFFVMISLVHFDEITNIVLPNLESINPFSMPIYQQDSIKQLI